MRYVSVPNRLILSFYIKPQRLPPRVHTHLNCLILSFYIKPQRQRSSSASLPIVLYCLSTSNHNLLFAKLNSCRLSYIVFLHQTTTIIFFGGIFLRLSYIVFLHQTTTRNEHHHPRLYCLILSFYIKPQRNRLRRWLWGRLSYIVFLHQTTTTVS